MIRRKIGKKMCVMLLLTTILMVVSACKQLEQTGLSAGGVVAEAQVVQIGLNRGGYTPAEITVSADAPVTLQNDGSLGGCGLYAVQPELGINANFAKNNEYTFTPTKKGSFTYTCSMGMFSGVINII